MKMNSDKAAGWIANAILKVQRKFANRLERKSASWKRKQQWIFLYMVCLVFGGLSTIAITNSFNKKTKQILLKPAAIKKTMIPDETPTIRITDNEIRKVENFKKSLDSVSKRRLLEQRPGLMDSLEMVEQLYHSQKK